MARVHLGSGFVYLTPSVLDDPDGWVNVECRESGAVLARDNRELAGTWATTDDNYYGRFQNVSKESLRDGAKEQQAPPVCDVFGNHEHIPVPDCSVSEILARQMFEHLSIREARKMLTECHRILKSGGTLRLDVPDHDGTIEMIRKDADPFWARHLLGCKRNDVAYHVMSYTRETLAKLADEYGFDLAGEEPNVHFYPAFCLRFTKPPANRPPWEYNFALAGITIPKEWKCLEIGTLRDPWPRADVTLDIQRAVLVGKANPSQGDVQRLPWKDRVFSFLYASHVLEHCEDPRRAAAEMSRVSQSGLIECPHPYKEALFNFHDQDHLWDVWPAAQPGGALRMFRRNQERMKKLYDPDFSKVMERLLRLGPPRFENDSIVARRWYQKVEPYLNVIHPWTGELRVEVYD